MLRKRSLSPLFVPNFLFSILFRAVGVCQAGLIRTKLRSPLPRSCGTKHGRLGPFCRLILTAVNQAGTHKDWASGAPPKS